MNIQALLAAHHAKQPGLLMPTAEQVLRQLPDSIQRRLSDTPMGQRMAAYKTIHEPSLAMLRRANLIATQSDAPVLIMGESGTGKELLAKIMLNQRPNDQFFAQNCAGIPEHLFESLMFGHKAGSFTGAVRDSAGLLVSAGSGIAFLDEIGELPLFQQAKLLRAIQDRRVLPVGSPYTVPISCRFVFATNRDLAKEVTAGRFREDLFYRISALYLETYPLRVRPDDALLIANDICNARGWEAPFEIPERIVNAPGNVRVLENWLLQRHVYGIGKDNINPAVGDNRN